VACKFPLVNSRGAVGFPFDEISVRNIPWYNKY